MTSSNLSINQKKFTLNNLKSYWWLALINGIVFFFIGPVALMLYLSQDVPPPYTKTSLLDKWFSLGDTGISWFYFVAIIIAAIMAVIVFSYLHNKAQINFYHSLPLTRISLFGQNYLAGILLAVIPMLLMLTLMAVMGMFYGSSEMLSFSVLLAHCGRILLFFLVSYSLGVLAVQLTGTILTSIFMTLFLQFGLFAVLGCLMLTFEAFWNTYSTNAMEWILNCSPLIYLVDYLNGQNYYGLSSTAAQPIVGMGGKAIAIMLLVSFAASLVALFLYRKRASEAASSPLIFAPSKPLMKWLLMFITGTLGGILFLEVGGKNYFIFGVVVFALLTHMFAEVIINKDFKALTKNLKGFVLYTVILLAFFGSLYYDVWGYDSYLPERDQVQKIAFDNTKGVFYTESAQLDTIMAITKQIVEQQNYSHNQQLYANKFPEGNRMHNSEYINVTYQLANGKEVSRNYSGVDALAYQSEFAQLYNSDEYKTLKLKDLMALKTEQLERYSIRTIFDNDNIALNIGSNYTDSSPANGAYTKQLIAALQTDAQQRQFSALQKAPLYIFDSETIPGDRIDGSYGRMNLEIYPDDHHTLAVIDQLIKDNKMTGMTQADVANQIDKLSIYKVKENLDISNGSVFYNLPAEMLLADDQIELVEEISDPLRIRELVERSVTSGQLDRATPYLVFDPNYVLVAQTKDSADSQQTPDRQTYRAGTATSQVDVELKLQLYFLAGQTPVGY